MTPSELAYGQAMTEAAAQHAERAEAEQVQRWRDAGEAGFDAPSVKVASEASNVSFYADDFLIAATCWTNDARDALSGRAQAASWAWTAAFGPADRHPEGFEAQ